MKKKLIIYFGLFDVLKLIDLGDTGFDENTEMPEGMKRFLNDAKYLGKKI